MKPIVVKHISADEFLVTVNKKSVTQHTVFVSDKVHDQFSNGQLTKEQLLKKSFLFLLQREDQTSILKTFNIEVIESYFPEYCNIAKIGWIDVSG